MPHSERLLILDFGSPHTQRLARRIRDLKVYSGILPCNATLEEIRAFNPRGIVLAGGAGYLEQAGELAFEPEILTLNLPILAISAGARLLLRELGGELESAPEGEADDEEGRYSPARATRKEEASASAPLIPEGEWEVVKGEGNTPLSFPEGFESLAEFADGSAAAFGDGDRQIWGLFFHPELSDNEANTLVLQNFFDICQLSRNWTPANFVKAAVERIKAETEGKRVLCALSGGVDSAVAAMLIHRAIGDKLSCVFVDNGLLRQGEREQVEKSFGEDFKLPLTTADAADRFLGELSGVSDPEEKRKIIGRVFIEVFEDAVERIAAKDGAPEFLAQGTLYSDVVESISFKSGKKVAVKSHHNVGGLPERMKLKLLEPLRDLYKDEVRAVGRELGLPEALVERQPFPGPGLAIRVLGAVSAEKVAIVRAADAIVREEIQKAGLHQEIWQFFAVLLPVKTVGVTNDLRTYEHVCALRAVTSVDGMSADWAKIPHEVLGLISNRIIREVDGINRLVYDITGKPPGTIEWE